MYLSFPMKSAFRCVVFFAFMAFYTGCTNMNSYITQNAANTSSSEIIYKAAKLSLLNPRIAIFPISSASAGKSLDVSVGATISDAILKRFSPVANYYRYNSCAAAQNILLDVYYDYNNLEKIFETARTKKYNYIIVADILMAMEGSDISTSIVAEQFRLYSTEDKQLLLYLKAKELGNPSLRNDYIFFATNAQSSRSMSTLMAANAEKMAYAMCNDSRIYK